ncbi:MAG: AEC family transporter [Clostridia bacterium]|nr:AEC family transporter [Clostridia bacterium]
MFVMFLCIAIGYMLNKKQILPDNTAAVLSKLETFVLVPCLIINTFMKNCTVASLKDNYKLVLYALVIILLAMAIAYLLSGFFTKNSYRKNIYRYALTFGNFVFLGNAIVPQILGEEMLYQYLLFTLPLNIAVYTWGVMILIPAGEEKKNPLTNLLNPVVISMGIGMFFGLTGMQNFIPDFVATSLNNLSACMGPLAMILTGFVIGNYDIKKLLTNVKVYEATALRLFILPALFVVILTLLGADKTTLILCLFAFATPLGLNTVVFPAAYGSDTSTGASMAMISHTLSVITLPVMYTLLMFLF